MKKNRRKLLSLLLAVAMVVTTYHVPSRAAGIDGIKDLFNGEFNRGIEKDGAYLNVPKLGEQEETAEEIKPIDLSEVLRVSIVLDKPGTIDAGYQMKNIAKNSSAMAYRQTVRAQQAAVTAQIERATGKKLDVKWNLTLAANIISANMTRGDMLKASLVSGVKKIVPENRYEAPIAEPETSITPGMIGADTGAWANGYYGAGSRIMIIDTGTADKHISFDPEAFEYALTKDGNTLDSYGLLTKAELQSLEAQLNANNVNGKHMVSAESAYINSKLPYAYNYIDENYVTDNSTGGSEHGSHVAGIAAANRFVKQNGKFVDAREAVLTVGVAPDAQVLTAKVFGAAGGAYDSDYFAAIEDAIIMNCDAVNLSLGSAVVGFAFSDEYQKIMESLTEGGLVMVTSAGNSYAFNNGAGGNYTNTDYPYNYIEDINKSTGGSPGSFVNTLGVASAESIGLTDYPLVFNGDQTVYYWETTADTSKNPPVPYGNPEIKTIAGTYDYVLIDGVGEEEEYAAVNEAVPLKGKIVMVFRGKLSFFEKGNNAIPYEPAAVIVVNNQPGEIRMALTGYEGDFPMVSMSLDNGEAVIEASEAGTAGDYNYYTGKVEVKNELVSSVVADEPTMSDFSSWGGNGSLLIKPEITAPGGNIYSVNGFTTDGYENMSGTSMAAPQVTGMMGLFSEYYEKALKAYVEAAFPGQFTQRQLAHSLLMSTAVPMIEAESETYYPILRQGAGLASIGNAVAARSFLMMGKDATISYEDGKVKAELGQSIAGTYGYSFTIYNPSEYDLIYDLSTDLFTQFLAFDGENYYMDDTAMDMPGNVSYEFPQAPLHDVDKDGDTDTDDVQAILDYLTGKRDGKDLDLSTPVADLDEDKAVTSLDAKLLLDWLHSMNGTEEDEDTVLVPAGTSKTVKVSIDVSSWQPYIDEIFVNGMWVQGYTFVTCQSVSDDGELLEVEHSIPLQGFFGSFTDASMYDANSYLEELYGNKRLTYSGAKGTNYMTVKYQDGTAARFSGNPYMIEKEIPEARFALNSEAAITNFNSLLIRAAGTMAIAVVKLDDNGEPAEVLAVDSMSSNAYPLYFYVNEGRWMNNNPINTKTNLALSDLGVEEGDKIRIGYYAIPEYYAMQLNDAASGTLTEDEFKALLLNTDSETILGSGAYLGYDFTVDNTAPKVTEVKVDQETGKITVTAQDNEYIAYIAVYDLGGNIEYLKAELPAQSAAGEEVTYTFDASALDDPAVAVVVADYACNETAKLAKLSDEDITMKVPIYVLTDKLVAGEEYIIASSKTAGPAYALGASTPEYFVDSVPTAITVDEEFGTYINGEDADSSTVWMTAEGIRFQNNDLGTWLGYYQGGYPFANWEDAGYADTFTYTEDNYLLVNGSGFGGGVAFLNGSFYYYYPAPIYLYQKQYVDMPVDPTEAWSITVTPETSTLILDVIPTVQLKADVQPVVLDDRGVTWTSSDETVATVDEDGLVTAVGLGTAEITATTKAEPHLKATATINVTKGQSMDAEIYAQVAYSNSDVRFAKIDLSDMSVSTEGEAFSAFTGGGRSGNYVYGNDADNDIHRFDITNNYGYDSDYHFVINPQWALIDIASYPHYTLTIDDEEVSFTPDFIGFNASSNWLTVEGDSISYFTLSSYGTFVAAAFGGVIPDFTYSGTTYPLALVYYFLATDGLLYQWLQFYDPARGAERAVFGEVAHVNVLSFGDDLTAYSMAYYYDEETETEGVFIGDNTSKGIYFVDFSDIDFEAEEATEVDAAFIGRLEGATNLSSLYNADLDAVDALNGAAPVPSYSTERIQGMMDSVRIEGAITVAPVTEPEAPTETEPTAPAEEPTEAVTEPAEEPAETPAETEAPAPVAETEAPTEAEPTAPAEEPTEEVTEPAEEPAPAEEETKEATEAETEAPTEEVTEAETESETKAPTEEVTEAETEPETEASTEEVTEAETEPETEAPTEEETEAETEPAFGGLTAVVRTSGTVNKLPMTGTVSLMSATPSAETDADSDTTVITVTEDENVNNGKLTLTYDTESLKFKSVITPAEPGADVEDLFSSYEVDEEAGTVSFAYATRNAVEAGNPVLEVEFETLTCENSDVTTTTEERNEDLGLDEEADAVVESDHDWKLDSVEWEGDDATSYTKATFTFICQNNEEHVKVVVDEEIETETDANGAYIYTGEVTGPDGKTYTETKKVTAATPPTGDASNLPLFMTMGGAATAALLGVMRVRRKKEEED